MPEAPDSKKKREAGGEPDGKPQGRIIKKKTVVRRTSKHDMDDAVDPEENRREPKGQTPIPPPDLPSIPPPTEPGEAPPPSQLVSISAPAMLAPVPPPEPESAKDLTDEIAKALSAGGMTGMGADGKDELTRALEGTRAALARRMKTISGAEPGAEGELPGPEISKVLLVELEAPPMAPEGSIEPEEPPETYGGRPRPLAAPEALPDEEPKDMTHQTMQARTGQDEMDAAEDAATDEDDATEAVVVEAQEADRGGHHRSGSSGSAHPSGTVPARRPPWTMRPVSPMVGE